VNRKPSSVFIRIFFAFSLVGLAYTFSFFIEPISQGHSLFLFISAVILASLYSGLFAAILSSLFAAFLHSYAFQEPRNEIGIHSLGDLIQIVAFLDARGQKKSGAGERSARGCSCGGLT
jgi:K+-sensing histidine kinase KdpD